ncbi:trans-1,2-dihydrobenzene-1,2-diol dehydrogenase-like [Paramuricea clavata]|uniref:Trans-1,2-dihydrobenzene-1,2-diol dehydrogenase-like, partial n=1 Tax=Paramuricea clavata TaxID=317549 RepID=A0A6S7FL43_PARCT|nr:trans-1,2-dihydrobenzene-1,2-diol dehydrogenase-like [Paramuricea clavata]
MFNNKRIDLKYIVEEYTSVAEKFVANYRLSGTRVFHSNDRQSVLSDTALQACVIATPTNTHEALILASLEAGKAVFCEKPLANSVEAIAKCYDEAHKRNLQLMCSFNRRFDPGFREIYNRAKAGELGQVQMAKQTSRDYPLSSMEYFRNTKGIYHDCAVHNIDLVTRIFGERPRTVYTTAHAFIKEIGEMNDVDTVAICLKFPSGGIGLIDISRYACFGYDQRLEVFGDQGMLTEQNYRATNVTFSGQDGATTGRIYDSFADRYAESYVKALDHFVDVVQGKCVAEITKESTLLVSEIVDACDKSLATGQPVTLPE